MAEKLPPHRYTAQFANEIETRWQAHWRAHGTYHVPNPRGDLAKDPGGQLNKPKLFVMDMFPYPSGAGLHVGHPLGFIATDVFVRYKRMCGFNVLHTMGFDAFGLPAEEHARQTGEHPRKNTEQNIATMTRQLERLGLGHDERRRFATTDPDYYRWTQWIFLQLFNSWFDPDAQRARLISDLVAELDAGRALAGAEGWSRANEVDRAQILEGFRLAYVSEAPVNWCPGLGTVLANEEVTTEGLSERGNHPVFRRPLKQWMMRITAYADRLLNDLELLDWSDSIKTMQRNWIGRSNGAYINFGPIEVFTTRPDTIFGTTFMVLAPEHHLVDELVADVWPIGTTEALKSGFATPREAVANYRAQASKKAAQGAVDDKEKTGVFIGASCVVPVNGREVPIFVADYVMIDYGTGALMGVPGQDQRDWDFATKYGLEIVRTVEPPSGFEGEAYVGDGHTINSDFLDGLGRQLAIERICEWLSERGLGKAAVGYKLRDWLFSRQRYWGEPIPIAFDGDGLARAMPEEDLPVLLPELIDWAPRSLDEDSEPEPPLGRVADWREVTLDLGFGEAQYRRELNTMPNWAGSCWYYLRYLDPFNNDELVDPQIERYWMGGNWDGRRGQDGEAARNGEGEADSVGGVDLYVGGVEHAVLHLLYARFWHKVLFDLGYVSGPEPFKRLVNQGYIQAAAYQDHRGAYVPAEEVVGDARSGFTHNGVSVTRTFGKMGKSLKNAVTPDEIYQTYGADTLRLYEMSMGPIDQDRPWETRSVVGSFRLLQRVWRNLIDEESGELRVSEAQPDPVLMKLLHKTIDEVRTAFGNLRCNIAIAKITELNNELTKTYQETPRVVARALAQMLAPLVPHMAEELWARLGEEGSVVLAPFPVADQSLLVEKTIEMPVQVNGRLRARIFVSPEASDEKVIKLALAEPNVAIHIDGQEIRKSIVVRNRVVSFVV